MPDSYRGVTNLRIASLAAGWLYELKKQVTNIQIRKNCRYLTARISQTGFRTDKKLFIRNLLQLFQLFLELGDFIFKPGEIHEHHVRTLVVTNAECRRTLHDLPLRSDAFADP